MKTIAIVVLLSAAAVTARAGQDPLRPARDLYASAAYDEALSELARVGEGTAAAGVLREADAYRAFCLVALGRTSEAEAVAEALVRTAPMMAVDLHEASPRIQEMFASVRRRLLPQLIRDEYRIARSLAAQKSPEAEAHLTHVQRMMAEAEKAGAWDDTLADLRVLVDGFLDLSRAAAPVTSSAAAQPVSEQSPVASPNVAAPDGPRIFTAGDAGVVAPVVLFQPPLYVPATLLDLVKRLRRTCALDIVIDERGGVVEAVVRESVNTAYDTLAGAAARTWKYRPATKDGVPVRFVKTVVLNAHGE